MGSPIYLAREEVENCRPSLVEIVSNFLLGSQQNRKVGGEHQSSFCRRAEAQRPQARARGRRKDQVSRRKNPLITELISLHCTALHTLRCILHYEITSDCSRN